MTITRIGDNHLQCKIPDVFSRVAACIFTAIGPGLFFFWPQPQPIYILAAAALVVCIGIFIFFYAATITLDINKGARTFDIYVHRIIGGLSARIDTDDIEDIVIETYVREKTAAELLGKFNVCLALNTGARIPILSAAHNESIPFAKTIAELLQKGAIVHEKYEGESGLRQRWSQVKRPDLAIENISPKTPLSASRESVEMPQPHPVQSTVEDLDLPDHKIVRKPKSWFGIVVLKWAVLRG